MPRPPVLVSSRIPAAVLARLEERCEVEADRGEALTPEELRTRVLGKQGLVCVLRDRIDSVLLDAAIDLKVVSVIAVGYDNIDVPHARSRGIVVTNTPDVLTEATAEFTWGLILAVTRRIAEGDRLIRAGSWKGWSLDFMLGMELQGKQLGIVGAGRIGRAVARRAPAFGMRVVYAAREPASGRSAVRAEDSGTPRLPLDELLRTSDVVSLHVPLTPATRGLIDRRALARMKRTAYLINTTRGPVVDEEGVAWALRERLIAGAALDVFSREPEVHADLLPLENVVLAPHLGSATIETRTAMADLAVRNCIEVLEGRPPLTPVT